MWRYCFWPTICYKNKQITFTWGAVTPLKSREIYQIMARNNIATFKIPKITTKNHPNVMLLFVCFILNFGVLLSNIWGECEEDSSLVRVGRKEDIKNSHFNAVLVAFWCKILDFAHFYDIFCKKFLKSVTFQQIWECKIGTKLN